jgi:hypothetical protein
MYVRATQLLLVLLCGLAIYAASAQSSQDVHSLKGPFTLPFWSMQGGTSSPAPPPPPPPSSRRPIGVMN